ncbi:MAG: hypothetical protein DYG88_13180 [Chloroflexi bacterium CFX4]|nr:hypothetical protein [Chloroflexi bacterium CFX4]
MFVIRLLPRLALIALCALLVRAPQPDALTESLRRAATATQRGDLGIAFHAYQAALAYLPNDSYLLHQLYALSMAARRYDMAAAYLTRLTALNGYSSLLHRLWAEHYSIQGNAQAADAHHLAALRGTPSDLPLLRALADSALARRDWQATDAYLVRAAALAPDDPDLRYQRALLSIADQPQAAAIWLADLPDNSRYSAAPALRALIATYADAPPTAFAFRCGLALIEARQWRYAERALLLANAQGAESAAALAFLGLAQTYNGRDGFPILAQAMQAAPDDPLVQYAAGLYWRLRGDLAQALEALRLAHALDSQNAALAAEIGNTYRAVGNLEEAARWLKNAVRLAPESAVLRRTLTAFYADENYALNGEGMNALRDALALLPEDAEIAANYGYGLLYNGQVAFARAELQRALALDSQNARARYYFGVLLEHQGDALSAVESYLFTYRAEDASLRQRAARALQRLGYPLG